MQYTFEQFGITEEEKNIFLSSPNFLVGEQYEKFNSWYARHKGTCSCVKTPIETIKQFYDENYEF